MAKDRLERVSSDIKKAIDQNFVVNDRVAALSILCYALRDLVEEVKAMRAEIIDLSGRIGDLKKK